MRLILRKMWQTSQLPARLLGLLMVSAFAVGFGLGCIVDDPLYCSSNDDCLRITGEAGMQCHPYKNVCTGGTTNCDDDSDCLSDTNSRCDSETKLCQPCRPDVMSDTSCAHLSRTPLCGKTSTGVAQCVGCRSHSDCTKESPICDSTTLTCRKCKKHSDCEGTLKCDDGNECTDSMVCLGRGDLDDVSPGLDGRCAQNGNLGSGRVIYVNGDQAICPDNVSGRTATTLSNAVCKLEQAIPLAVAQARPVTFIRVLGMNGKNYLPLPNPIDTGRYVFIGAPGKNIATRAVVGTRATTFRTEKSANVTLDSFDIRADTENLMALVSCSANGTPLPKLWIRDSVIRGANVNGPTANVNAISATDCHLRVTGTLIGVDSLSRAKTDPSHHTAINYVRVGMGEIPSLTVENSVFAGLISKPLNLLFIGNTKTTLRFLTFAANGRGGNIGGNLGSMYMPDAPLISNSVFFDITPNGNKSIFLYDSNSMTSYWRYQKLVVPEGISETDPELTKATVELEDDYSLKINSTVNRSTCIDQIQVGADLPTIDFRGNPRPGTKDGKLDIGAFEVQ